MISRLSSRLLQAGTLPLLVAAAVAAGEQRILEEIVVTATKREVRLQDLAMSVGVLDAAELTDSGALSLDGWWRMVPSLNVKDAAFGGDFWV